MDFFSRLESDVKDLAATIIVISIIVMLLISILMILSYVLNAFALMRLGERRGIKNSWLAWLPFGNSYIIGKITDEYEGRNGIKRKWVAWLLSLDVVAFVVSVFQSTYQQNWLNNIDWPQITERGTIKASELERFLETLIDDMDIYLQGIAVIMTIAVVTGIISLFQTSLRMVCIYKIYESSVPKRSVIYLVLSLFVPLAESICLMACRNKGYEYVTEMPMYNQDAPAYAEVPEQPTNPEQ